MRLALVICLLAMLSNGYAHQDPNNQLMQIDSVNVEVSADNQYFFLHAMSTKQTLYSVSKIYNVQLEDIYRANPELVDRIVKAQEVIKIPVKNWRIDAHAKSGPKVYYTIKPKETLFRVARIYFDLQISDVRLNNELSSNELDIGQALYIGRLQAKKSSPSSNNFQIDSLSNEPVISELTGQSWVEEKNIAYWLKEAYPDHSLVVLSNDAPVNSWVAITNPMYAKTVSAKVIGRIPENVYPGDIDIIISHGVAANLGAIDARFYVKVKHLKLDHSTFLH